MLKLCGAAACFGLLILGIVLIARHRRGAGRNTTREDPAAFWLLIVFGLVGGVVLAVL